MKSPSYALLIASTAALLSAAPALAAAAAPGPVVLEGDVKLETKVVENGVERLVLADPKVVVPGNRLLFSTRYRNAATTPVRNFVVTNPLPAGVALASDADAALELSVDGGKTWGRLAALKVKAADGTSRAAAAGDVSHVRWTLPVIAPAQDGSVSFHAVVK